MTGSCSPPSRRMSSERDRRAGARLTGLLEHQRRKGPGDEAVDDRAEHAGPEPGHMEAGHERAHRPEQQPVDHEDEQAQRDDGDRQRQQQQQRADERIDEAERQRMVALFGKVQDVLLTINAEIIQYGERLQVVFKEGDARNPRLPETSFDCVAIMGNSFGYFSNKQDDEKVLTEN